MSYVANQPFTAPIVMLAMNLSWKAMNTISSGIVESTAFTQSQPEWITRQARGILFAKRGQRREESRLLGVEMFGDSQHANVFARRTDRPERGISEDLMSAQSGLWAAAKYGRP